MSDRADDLKARLETMAGEWLAEHGGGFLTGFHVFVTFVDEEGDRGWVTACDDATANDPRLALGGLRFHQLTTERDIHDYLDAPGGYDDE